MFRILDFVELDQFLPVIALTILLAYVGDRMAAGRQRVLTWARWSAVAGLIVSTGFLIDLLNPTTPVEFLVVVIRALMAAGLCWSTTLIVAAIIASIWTHVISPVIRQHNAILARSLEIRQQRSKQADAARNSEQEQEELRRREQRSARALRRSQRQAAIADQERIARIREAREEVSRFYEENITDLRELLPRSLFRVRLQNQLNPGVLADQAWSIAETMIAEIVVLVERVRTSRQAVEAGETRILAQISSLHLQISEIERQKTLFAQSPAADSEIVAHELRAFDHQIAAIRDQIEMLTSNKEIVP